MKTITTMFSMAGLLLGYYVGFQQGRSVSTFVIAKPINLDNIGDIGLTCQQSGEPR